jgi:uncharacterized RmlC-like cupin family protein
VSEVLVIKPTDRRDTVQTVGMNREEAVTGPGFWSGLATADPGSASGWHPHGEHDSVIYVVTGTFRVKSGPGGRDVAEAAAGDFMLIPKGVVHREENPGEDRSQLVVVRVGTGEPVFNVDGPDPA